MEFHLPMKAFTGFHECTLIGTAMQYTYITITRIYPRLHQGGTTLTPRKSAVLVLYDSPDGIGTSNGDTVIFLGSFEVHQQITLNVTKATLCIVTVSGKRPTKRCEKICILN